MLRTWWGRSWRAGPVLQGVPDGGGQLGRAEPPQPLTLDVPVLTRRMRHAHHRGHRLALGVLTQTTPRKRSRGADLRSEEDQNGRLNQQQELRIKLRRS